MFLEILLMLENNFDGVLIITMGFKESIHATYYKMNSRLFYKS